MPFSPTMPVYTVAIRAKAILVKAFIVCLAPVTLDQIYFRRMWLKMCQLSITLIPKDVVFFVFQSI